MNRITSPFGAYTSASDVVAGHDLSGRTVVVTGAATGIGIETARALASGGAIVTLAVRNRDAGANAAADINASIGADRARVGTLDLSSLASVAAFVSAWGDAPLDILINNAGVMACPQSYTADDLEMQIGTNHLGHYLLTLGLVPALRKAATTGRTARVVALSSTGHMRGGMNFEDPHYRRRPYDKWEAYGQSKTANALFAVGFNTRFADLGITANAAPRGRDKVTEDSASLAPNRRVSFDTSMTTSLTGFVAGPWSGGGILQYPHPASSLELLDRPTRASLGSPG